MTAERIAPFEAKVVTLKVIGVDSAGAPTRVDTSAVDLTEAQGIIIYDMQCDGLYDDSLPIYGDNAGLITGIIRYSAPIDNPAPWLRRTANIKFDSLGIDTFLTVDPYLQGESAHVDTQDWGVLVAKHVPSVEFDSVKTAP